MIKKCIITLNIIALFFLSFLLFCSNNQQKLTIMPGIDSLHDSLAMKILNNKNIGIITNQTGVNSQGQSLADIILADSSYHLAAIFSPEHGFYGTIEGGKEISTNIHEKYQCPIFSLYGKNRKPTRQMLQEIDVLLFDIQDIGARFYTYISTMYYAMEAAAENNIPFVVLDRPNPIGGYIVEGPVLKEGLESFVGIKPIPLRHGMTVGELALLFKGEKWYASSSRATLHIIPVSNWSREIVDAGETWINPSPNIGSLETALLYPGMGLLEGTNLSEGRGTKHPFKYMGAPWLNHVVISKELMKLDFDGISIDTVTYIPVDIPGAVVNPKYEGEVCKGLKFDVTDGTKFKSVAFATHVIALTKKVHPVEFQWSSELRIDRMAGNRLFRESIDSGKAAVEVIDIWNGDLAEFKKKREKYLLYH